VFFLTTNNLRAVLDQAGYASAVAAKSPSLKSVKFPFGPTLQHWQNNVTGGCKDLPPEIRAIFESQKSYKGGNDILWAVNEIANANKHLALKPLIISSPDAFFTLRSVGPGGMIEAVSPGGFGIGWDAKNRQLTLCSLPAAAKTDINLDLTFSVAVDGIDVIANQQARSFLNSACNEIERILMATETECRRLGLLNPAGMMRKAVRERHFRELKSHIGTYWFLYEALARAEVFDPKLHWRMAQYRDQVRDLLDDMLAAPELVDLRSIEVRPYDVASKHFINHVGVDSIKPGLWMTIAPSIRWYSKYSCCRVDISRRTVIRNFQSRQLGHELFW
jgi:hypothetical protein